MWKTSRELGLSTWWLGPVGEPQPIFVTMLPFVAPLAMVLLAVNNVPVAALVRPRGGGGARVIAVLDLGKVPGWPSSSWPSPAPGR